MFVIQSFFFFKSEEMFRTKLFELPLRIKLNLSIKSVCDQKWSGTPVAPEAEAGEP